MVAKLNIELKEEHLLDTDMVKLEKFLKELPYGDLVDVHNIIVEEVNKR